MTLEKAYEIFSDMGNDIEQLKGMPVDAFRQVRNRLALIYHPDMGVFPNEEKMKEINEAWDIINSQHVPQVKQTAMVRTQSNPTSTAPVQPNKSSKRVAKGTSTPSQQSNQNLKKVVTRKSTSANAGCFKGALLTIALLLSLVGANTMLEKMGINISDCIIPQNSCSQSVDLKNNSNSDSSDLGSGTKEQDSETKQYKTIAEEDIVKELTTALEDKNRTISAMNDTIQELRYEAPEYEAQKYDETMPSILMSKLVGIDPNTFYEYSPETLLEIYEILYTKINYMTNEIATEASFVYETLSNDELESRYREKYDGLTDEKKRDFESKDYAYRDFQFNEYAIYGDVTGQNATTMTIRLYLEREALKKEISSSSYSMNR